MFGKTLRSKPAEAEMPSHELLLRAGMIARLAAGIYNYMPLAWRVVRKIENIMREEMDAIGGQEINMPVVHPADLWKESGRYFDIGPEMVRFRDRSGRDMVLAMTHEETVTDLARRFAGSYRDLPFMVYQIQTKFRDEPRPRGGLVRVREFVMKDAYSFHRDASDLDRYYEDVCTAYRNICQRCGVPVVQVLSDVGMMGGSQAHEFMYVTSLGEDTLVLCQECGYAANREVATVARDESGDRSHLRAENAERPGGREGISGATGVSEGKPEKVATPGKNTIDLVCSYLGVSPKQSIKTMVYAIPPRTEGRAEAGKEKTGSKKRELVLVVLRGDLEVNERKLANLLKVGEVEPASPEEIKEAGLVQGYMSPVVLKGFKVVADLSLREDEEYVAGANEEGYHLTGVRPGRDFPVDYRGDVIVAREGDPCPRCGKPLKWERGIEVGNTFKLGLKYSSSMGATFRDEDGKDKPMVMGCYGMGVGRLLACVVEANRDSSGIIWPITVAPYEIHLLTLGASPRVRETAEAVYARWIREGKEVLYDDRDESAGVKLKDADLLGMPIRVLISDRTLGDEQVEVKLRRDEAPRRVGLGELDEMVNQLVAAEFERFSPGASRPAADY